MIQKKHQIINNLEEQKIFNSLLEEEQEIINNSLEKEEKPIINKLKESTVNKDLKKNNQ